MTKSSDNQSINTSCEACEFDSPIVSEQDLKSFLSTNAEWKLITDTSVRKIKKRYRFRNFAEAMVFTNSVAELAEEHGHHPTITTEWGAVTLEWWSHKIANLHSLDLELAQKCDAILA